MRATSSSRADRDPAAVLKLQFDAGLPAIRNATPISGDLLRQTLAADPEDIETRYRFALWLFEKGRSQEALAQIEKILLNAPDHLHAVSARGILLQSSDPEQAVRDFKAVLAHPRFPEFAREKGEGLRVFHKLSRALIRLGRLKEAESVARSGLTRAYQYQDLRGESHYALAVAIAHSASPRQRRLKEVAEQLTLAHGFRKDLPSIWFEQDPLLDDIRDILRPILAAELR